MSSTAENAAFEQLLQFLQRDRGFGKEREQHKPMHAVVDGVEFATKAGARGTLGERARTRVQRLVAGRVNQ